MTAKQMTNTDHAGCCQCGTVQYSVSGEPMMTYACHCTDCQKRTGSAFSMGCIYPLSALSLDGALSTWKRISDDGNSNTRYSCAECGNVIYGVSTIAPEIIKLQPGTLESARAIAVDAHIWLRSACSWLVVPEDALRYDTQPDSLLEIYQHVVERKQ